MIMKGNVTYSNIKFTNLFANADDEVAASSVVVVSSVVVSSVVASSYAAI